jgi:hypothetical protein
MEIVLDYWQPIQTHHVLKGTVARDSRPLVFSINLTHLSPNSYPKIYIRIRFRIRRDIRIQSLTGRQ